jgi:hypothetical protein
MKVMELCLESVLKDVRFADVVTLYVNRIISENTKNKIQQALSEMM